MEETFPVYIGFDDREKEAFDVCKHSLIRNSSWPLCVTGLDQRMLRYIGLYRREFETREGINYDIIDKKPFSTDFSFTRFLVPALTQYYNGWALFCDSDMLFRTDIRHLIGLCNDDYAVMVVKHTHEPDETEKMDAQVQQRYFRKNWSSFVLWNCGHPSNLSLSVDAVNTEPGSWLHAFSWLRDEEIGELPERWNWLEGYSHPDIVPANVHYTRGGPWFEDYKNVAYADEWLREKALIENGHEHNQRKHALRFTAA